MLSNVHDIDPNENVQGCLQPAEEARQLAHAPTTKHQLADAGGYNMDAKTRNITNVSLCGLRVLCDHLE